MSRILDILWIQDSHFGTICQFEWTIS
jgi:hypothetical protein